jgi:hypothetical protein
MKYLFLGISLLLTSSAFAQEAEREYILHPDPIPEGKFQSGLGLLMVVLPRQIVEEQIRSVPMLDYQCRYGLPENFSLLGRVSSNYLTNSVSIMPQWAHEFNRLSVGVGFGLAYWFGFVNMDGFNVTASSWLNSPNVFFGVDFVDWLLTVWFDTQIIATRSTKTEGVEVGTDKNSVASYGIGLAIEQPFFGRTSSVISFKANFAKALYHAWLAFSTFNNYLLYPELTFSLLF